MKLTCQRFLLLLLVLQSVSAQNDEQEISSGFKKSINKFIERIAELKKNMKKLTAEREKERSKKKQILGNKDDKHDRDEYEDEEIDNDNDFDENLKVSSDKEKFDDLDEDISIKSGIDNRDIEFETDDDFDFIQEVDDIEDSLKSEGSFLDKLLLNLSKKEAQKRGKKAKIKDIISRVENRDFLTGLKEKSNRVNAEQRRLSGFLDRFRSSQSNLNRQRSREDPLRTFRNILGNPPSSDLISTRFREDPLEVFEENRSVFSKEKSAPVVQVNKAFRLLDGFPGAKAKDGNIFVFTFADSNNPVLVFDG